MMLKIYKTLHTLTLGQETNGINSQGSPINNKYQESGKSDKQLQGYVILACLPENL